MGKTVNQTNQCCHMSLIRYSHYIIHNVNCIDVDKIEPENSFEVESKWKDESLLFSTVQAYTASTGWKPTLSHSIYIRCSYYNRPTRNKSEKDQKFASSPLCKDCKWEIKIRSTVDNTKKINS